MLPAIAGEEIDQMLDRTGFTGALAGALGVCALMGIGSGAAAQDCDRALSLMHAPDTTTPELHRFVMNARLPFPGIATEAELLGDLCAAGVQADMISIKADWLIARDVTAGEYFGATIADIKRKLREDLRTVTVTDDQGVKHKPNQDGLGDYSLSPLIRVVMLDIEPQLTDDPTHPGALHPNKWGDWVCPRGAFWTPDDRFTLGSNPPVVVSSADVFAAYRRRIQATREVLDESDPSVRIVLFAVPVPIQDGAQEVARDGVFREVETRLVGLEAARAAGVFNFADALGPTLYPHELHCDQDLGASGPCTDYYDHDGDGDDRDAISCIVRMTNQGVDLAWTALNEGQFTNHRGAPITIFPILNLTTRLDVCSNVLPGAMPVERLAEQIAALRAKGVKEYAYWHGDAEWSGGDTGGCRCQGLTHLDTMGDYFLALFDPQDLNGDGLPCRLADRTIATLRVLDLDCDGQLTPADTLVYINACAAR